ncbi:autotransporter assembly complex family protein [Parvibaculum sp.]|uniref:autotransporter assembly complex protein TamA n=1 Tax=Parvibaculum sp. TaxID=2024848 RepID=UPI0026378E12|nr:autotransporter assembly complex family protein [Parvibaculum sp.]MCW5725845.1 outer membrane protein assembly factor [Parvibaculum sp.]
MMAGGGAGLQEVEFCDESGRARRRGGARMRVMGAPGRWRAAALVVLAALLVPAAPAHARAAEAPAESATTPSTPRSWDRPQAALDFTTRVTGRRIPDEMREMLEDARQLGVDLPDAPPPPTTLAQLRRRAQDDSRRLVEVLRSEAYYNGRVEVSVREAAGGGFDVIYHVVTGQRAMIRSFAISYPDLPDGADGLPQDGAALGLQPERAARAQRIIDLTNAAVRHLTDHGYPDAKLANRRVVVDLSSHQADVTLDIEAGPKMIFGPVLVRNEGGRTKADYVRALSKIEPGAVYDRSAVDATMEALRGTGLFESVAVAAGERAADGAAPQEIELTERPARTVRLGASWASSEGAGVRGSWEHRNLFGAAEKLTLGLAIAQIEQKATAEFRKPHFLRDDQSLLISAEIANATTDAYDEYRLRTAASLERRLGERLTGSAGVSFELTETEDTTGRTDYQLFGLPVVLRYDSADDLLDPRKGVRATAAATPFFGGADRSATTFLRFETTGATYFGLADALTLAVRGRYGSLVADATTDVPGSTRFYAGGGGSVRGYSYQMAGPVDAAGNPLGGLSVIEAGVEARYRATETIGVVAFVDGGKAYDDTLPGFDGSLLWGAGAGLRYYTPVGPVRLDVAVPLDRRRGIDDAFQIYVSLGQAF